MCVYDCWWQHTDSTTYLTSRKQTGGTRDPTLHTLRGRQSTSKVQLRLLPSKNIMSQVDTSGDLTLYPTFIINKQPHGDMRAQDSVTIVVGYEQLDFTAFEKAEITKRDILSSMHFDLKVPRLLNTIIQGYDRSTESRDNCTNSHLNKTRYSVYCVMCRVPSNAT
eukprot:m.590256 g.590256  ORF g.590256 m.590256 type:complete len:165 (+) comp22376_c0_seq16:1271-1765(+)